MDYIEICIETSNAGVEIVTGKLLAIGITDTVVDDPMDVQKIMEKKEDYEWDYIEDDVTENLDRNPNIYVYLEDTDENRRLANRVEEAMIDLIEDARENGYFQTMGVLRMTTEYKNDEPWKDKWKEFFKPKEVAPGIVVKPTWESYDNVDNNKVIEIDPGMAFGTGTHETTSLCIRMLAKYMDGKENPKVLDVGTGSGILSVAAAMLGADDVLGTDIDPAAVEVAKENINKNKVDTIAKAVFGDLTKGIDYKADIVVANLMADLVMMLSKDVRKHLNPGGIFISSGILVEKEKQVKEEIQKNGFKILEIPEDGEWCVIVATI